MKASAEIEKEGVPTPVLVSFGITQQCDLKCLHCYSNSGGKNKAELTTDEAKIVIDDIAALGAKILILDGGEPTFRPDLLELIRYATDRGVRTVIGSHGMAITEQLAQDLKDAGCKGVAISLDGAKAKTHDAWRGVTGAWQRTVEGAKNCAKAGLEFQIAPLLHKRNWKELAGIIDLTKKLGANAVEIFDFVPAGRGSSHQDYELNFRQRKQVINNIIKLQRAGDIIYRVIGLPQYWVAVEKEVPEDEILMSFVRSCCVAGIRYITILPNGDVVPCMVLQIILGNVRTKSLKTIWRESPILRDLRNRELLKGKCGRCMYKLVCAGARCKAYAKTGDMLAEDPTCWFMEKEIASQNASCPN